MAQVGAAKAPQGEGFQRKQVVLVTPGLYVGLLASYTLPKEFPKYKGKPGEMTGRMTTRWLLTNDHTLTRLPNLSSALMGINCMKPEGYEEYVPKHFYNPDDPSKISGYTAFVYAMTRGKISKEQIVEDATNYDLDEFVASVPAYLFIEHGKPNEEGLVTQRVKTITPADAKAYYAVKDIVDARVIGYSETNNLAFLESPKEVYVGEENHVTTFEEELEELPF